MKSRATWQFPMADTQFGAQILRYAQNDKPTVSSTGLRACEPFILEMDVMVSIANR
jgi:hypothetical protein